MREIIIMACEECKNRNYTTTKNKRKHTDRLQLKKYCSNCKKHTVHKQTR